MPMDGILQFLIQSAYGLHDDDEELVYGKPKASRLDPAVLTSTIHNIPGSPSLPDSEEDGDAREYLLGASASIVNILSTYPVYKVMFRQQLNGLTVTQAVVELKQEGYWYLFRGVNPPLIQRSLNMGIMFGMYGHSKQIIKKYFPNCSPNVYRPVAAICAGTVEAVLTPLERIQILLQDGQYNKQFRGTVHAFKQLKVYGYKEYYRGLSIILLRNGPCNAIFFGLRHPVKNAMPRTTNPYYTVMQHFASGALLGAFISTIFYPIMVIRTKMQSRLGGDFLNVCQAAILLYHERGGVRHMFRGIHLNWSRSIVSWGIVNVTYELLRKFFYRHW